MTRKKIKHIHEGDYVAEVEIELEDDGMGWSPTISLETAYRLDEIRQALREGHLQQAARYATIYEMKRIAG